MANHASTVRNRRGVPRVGIAQPQRIPVPAHKGFCVSVAPARHPLIRGGGEFWIAREKTYFVDSALDHSENRLWIMAEMERELIVERTRAGLAAAREQGRVGGRRRVMTEDVVERCRRMLENGATRQQVADVIGVDVKTIYKYLPAT